MVAHGTWAGSDFDFSVVAAVLVHDDRAFVIEWSRPPGREAADRATFERILGSLTFAG